MKTITYDPAIYKLVPIEPIDSQIADLATGYINGFLMVAEATAGDGFKQGYAAMLAAVPDSLPGVVTHSGGPAAYIFVEQGCRAPDDCEDYEVAYISSEIAPDTLKIYQDSGRAAPLFTHPAPDALSIIAATIEVAASLYDESPNAEQFHQDIADAIRAIDPQSIIDRDEP